MKAKKVAFIGISVALAMILSFVESQVPSPVAHLGIKLGLPNLVIMFLLYKVGWKESILVSLIRIILTFMIFGNIQAFIYSLAGAALSLAGMILLRKLNWFSCITVSIVGGILFNIGQVIAVYFVTSTPEFIIAWLPWLLVGGTVAGAVIGVVSGLLIKRLEKFKF